MKEYFRINNQFKKLLPIFLIMLSVVVLLGSSYALLRNRDVGENTYVMNVGLLEVIFLDSETSALTLENAYPMSDAEGTEEEKELIFTVKNTGDFDAKYSVYIEETSTNPSFKTVIRFISNKNDAGYNNPKTLSEDNYIDVMSSLAVGETATYKVKAWLDESADTTYMNKTFTARIVVEVIQSNLPAYEQFKQTITKTRSNLYLEDTDGTIYISGKQDDYDKNTTNDIDFNYVWYSGKLWRITAIYPDGTMKMVTDDSITVISWGADSTYATSWIREWLNQEFLPTLYNYEDIIVTDYKWNATTTSSSTSKPAEKTMITDPVGLLNAYEYYMSYKNTSYENGYLNIGYFWWLITPYDSSDVHDVVPDGYPGYIETYDYGFGVRPSINLKYGIVFIGGDGSYDNPYVLNDASEEMTNNTTLINTRVSGEYVKLENDMDTNRLFRIVGIENGTTKLVLVDYVKENDAVVFKFFSTDYTSTYGDGGTDDYWEYYLNNTYLGTLNSNMLEQGTYYLGMYPDRTSYKTTVCSSVDSAKSISDCINEGNVVDSKWIGYVGLLRAGEMFASLPKDYTFKNANDMCLITPYDTSNVHYVDYSGYLNYYGGRDSYGSRPSINLKSTIVVKSGSGTEWDPFVVGLAS